MVQLTWLEPFGTSTKQNAVCVGESGSVATKRRAATPAILKDKRILKKRKSCSSSLKKIISIRLSVGYTVKLIKNSKQLLYKKILSFN